MKITDKRYLCGFCGWEYRGKVNKYISDHETSKGKHNVTQQIKCQKCGNYISQK